MAVHRTLLAALLTCSAAAATLSACTPADSAPTVAAASAAAVADGAYDDEDDQDGDLGGPEPTMDTSPAPVVECATPTPTERPGHTVLVVVAVEGTEVVAQPARYLCDEARYEASGEPARYGFASAGVEASLVDRPNVDPTKPVRLEEVLGHLEECLGERDPGSTEGCYGNAYDVVLDSHGRIMRIGEIAEQP
ncbi:hypothetical protein ACFYUY_32475 [Kitasatospora sp. NPDC004745]|uniref:hypothetical protein n=1 Tax=unclassified Kitasatospora TaxID=2633591 RepID=UPI0033F8C026